MARIVVDPSVELFVQDLGDGPAVLFVAGFGLHHDVWDRQVRQLTGLGYRAICVDQRGHGLSDKPLAGYDVELLGADLVEVIHQLGLDAVTLVGWSFGGQSAFKAAALAPELVRSLVLVGSNGVRASRGDGFPFGRPAAELLPQLVAGEESDRIRARRAGITAAFANPPDEALLSWLHRCSLQMPSWAGVQCYRSMLEADLIADISKVSCPVLQIVGEADPVFSIRGAGWLSEQLSDAALVRIPDCGHYPMFEAPEQFDAALLPFLTGLDAGAPR